MFTLPVGFDWAMCECGGPRDNCKQLWGLEDEEIRPDGLGSVAKDIIIIIVWVVEYHGARCRDGLDLT